MLQGLRGLFRYQTNQIHSNRQTYRNQQHRFPWKEDADFRRVRVDAVVVGFLEALQDFLLSFGSGVGEEGRQENYPHGQHD